MAPIRIALVGLSSNAKTSWASNAHLPYLLSARGLARYQIVALLNSSEDAAKRAITAYNLDPSKVRAYGDPAQLAADPDVQLVVVNTRVDVHYSSALPAARAGKDVYVEWPLAQDAKHARELVDAAKKGGSKTVVGLQGRFSPAVLKVRELLRENEGARIGKVLSSEFKASGGTNARDALPTGLKYFSDKSTGGNIVTIGFAHLFDQIQHVLGEVVDIKATHQIQRPEVKITDPASGGAVVETVVSDVPDLVTIAGKIHPAAAVPVTEAGGVATFSARFRKGPPFPGEAPLVWTVSGEKGEIRLTSKDGTSLGAFAVPEPRIVIEAHDFASGEVETVEWGWTDWQKELYINARSVGSLYEAFAEGDYEHLVTFEDALARHEQIEAILA